MYRSEEEEKALSLISGFNFLTDEIVSESKEYLQQYGLYHKDHKCQEVFCTACRTFHYLADSCEGFHERRTVSSGKAIHGESGTCPLCDRKITYLADGKGRRSISDKINLVIFKAISKTQLVARCIRLEQRFAHPDSGRDYIYIDNNIFEHDYYEVARYYFETGSKPMKFTERGKYIESGYRYSWFAVSTFSEPLFVSSFYGSTADNRYFTVNEDDIYNTDFGYIMKAIYSIDSEARYSVMLSNLVTVLGEYCIHPQIEYLIKTGFWRVVEAKIRRDMCNLRLNWKSNDVRKVLGLNTEEMNLLKNFSASAIARYKELKKIDKKSSAKEITSIVKLCTLLMTDYVFVKNELIKNRGETCRSILKYVLNADVRISDWRDYVSQCKELEYDLSEKSVLKPSHFHEAHERCTNLIKIKVSKESDEKMKERAEFLKQFEFIDEELGLFIRIPQNTEEIVSEGKTLIHCVGGYAERHANGKTNIFFVRKSDDPDTPYYTMEVSNDYKIVQCRGYRNDTRTPKSDIVKQFEEKYLNFLEELKKSEEQSKRKKSKKTA